MPCIEDFVTLCFVSFFVWNSIHAEQSTAQKRACELRGTVQAALSASTRYREEEHNRVSNFGEQHARVGHCGGDNENLQGNLC